MIHPMLNTAIKAVRKAGNVINHAWQDTGLNGNHVESGNFLDEIEHTIELTFRQILGYAYPAHGIFSQRLVSWEGFSEPEYTWYLRPLSGGINFIHGYAQYATVIGLLKNQQMQHVAIYDSCCDELFTATRGSGAYLNNKRLRVTKCERLNEKILLATSCAFHAAEKLTKNSFIKNDISKDNKHYNLSIFNQLINLRCTGVPPLDLAYVAAGRFDGYFGQELQAFDAIAASLLVTEAGGLVGNYNGDSIIYPKPSEAIETQMIAANPRLFAQMVSVLTTDK